MNFFYWKTHQVPSKGDEKRFMAKHIVMKAQERNVTPEARQWRIL